MSVLSRLKQWASGAPRNDIGSAEIRLGDGVWESFTGGATAIPSEASALAISAVYSCVTLISGAIASMPMHIYHRAKDGDLDRDVNSPLWWILNEEFCPRWAAAPGWSFLVASKLLHGDAFAEILRRGPDIVGLVPIHPRRVRVVVSPDGANLIYEVQPDTTIQRPSHTNTRIIAQDDMLHVPGFGFNGQRGLSQLRSALRVAGNLATNAQNFSASFLQNMGRPDYVLKTAANLTDDQFKRLQDFLNSHSGPSNGGKPMILEGGLDVHPLTMPLEEMQLLETRKFQVEEIARIYGVPPFMIGHTEKTSSWGAGVSAMGAGFVRFTLRDHLNAFQNEINRKFFRTAARIAEFDTADLERADIGTLMTALRQGIGRAGEPPILSIDEARHTLRLPRKMTCEKPEKADPSPEKEKNP